MKYLPSGTEQEEFANPRFRTCDLPLTATLYRILPFFHHPLLQNLWWLPPGQSAPPALEGEVVTTAIPGKSRK